VLIITDTTRQQNHTHRSGREKKDLTSHSLELQAARIRYNQCHSRCNSAKNNLEVENILRNSLRTCIAIPPLVKLVWMMAEQTETSPRR
jgi:hypothetical protein